MMHQQTVSQLQLQLEASRLKNASQLWRQLVRLEGAPREPAPLQRVNQLLGDWVALFKMKAGQHEYKFNACMASISLSGVCVACDHASGGPAVCC
uniref:Uncharacterized protein n=1 Tax=Tetradesmus obliquus TaxID=3088 RepID=A0A383WIX4_TETOB|eukprot:jgi/Sobl393_1/1264/SZX77172.1